MDRPYCVVDAFTSDRFAGNPAAVVFDAEGLADARMQAIAAEFNVSESTFVLPPTSSDAHVRFRWFTPSTEVDMCGHATIAGIHAMVESERAEAAGVNGEGVIRIDTKSGTLTAFVEHLPGNEQSLLYWLELPRPRLQTRRLSHGELASLLNLSEDRLDGSLPLKESQDGDLLLFVRDSIALNEARPDWSRLAAFQQRERIRGLCLATVNTLTPAVNVQSRFFAPAVGIQEDPVTGSVHGPLTLYLAEQGLMNVDGDEGALVCAQGKSGGRAGMIFTLLRRGPGDAWIVRIGGKAVTAMRGTLMT